MSRYIIHMILLVCSLGLFACGEEVKQEDLIQSAVAIKLDQYRSNQLKECKVNAYRDAEDYVDSLLLAISLQTKLDTIPKPVKAVRPERPIFKEKPDSVVVDRMYKEEE